MSPASWILIAALACAQTPGEFAPPPAFAEMPVSIPAEWNVLPYDSFPAATFSTASYPTFALPAPTAPPPLPAFNADEMSLPATRFTALWLPSLGSQGFGIVDADCNHTFLLGYDEAPPLNITPGAGMHLWSGPRDLGLPARVYDLYLDLNWRPIDRDRWGLSLGLTPGFYGDFEYLDGDTFQLTGWLLGNLRLGTDWNVLGGIAYVRQLSSNLLPIGGVVWMPADDWRLELVIPKPRYVQRFRTDETGSSFWYVAGQLGGGTWAVANTPTENVLVGYTDLRLLLGIESFHVSGREWNLETGYVFSRQLSVNGNQADSPADTIVLQLSLSY
jgi:hypothetical protein